MLLIASFPHANLMSMRYLMSLVFCCVACLGGESGTPTPSMPKPGCTLAGEEPLNEADVVVFEPVYGEWTGECGELAFSIRVPELDASAGMRELYEWMAFGLSLIHI